MGREREEGRGGREWGEWEGGRGEREGEGIEGECGKVAEKGRLRGRGRGERKEGKKAG